MHLFRRSAGLLLCILCACSTPQPAATPTAQRTLTAPAPAATHTATQPRPTRAATPSTTPAASATPKTHSLEVPPPAPGEKYRLAEWTEERAGQLVDTLLDYPEHLLPWERGRYDMGYEAAFLPAALAELESARRFAASAATDRWRWDGAYQLRRSQQRNAGEPYRTLILEALNDGSVSLNALSGWFETKEPRLAMEVYPLKTPPGTRSSQLVRLRFLDGGVLGGGAVFWLLQKEDGFDLFAIENTWDSTVLDGEHTIQTVDITGDGYAEVILSNVEWSNNLDHQGELRIYRLDQIPYHAMEIDPYVQNMEIGQIALNEQDQTGQLRFSIPEAVGLDTGCGQFGAEWTYRWDGQKIRLQAITLPAESEMTRMPHCALMLAATLRGYALQGYTPAHDALEKLLAIPLVVTNAQGLYGSSASIRFGYGLLLAQQGNVAAAAAQMKQVNAQSVEDAAYERAANEFLKHYQDRDDLLTACIAAKECFPTLRIDDLLALMPKESFFRFEKILSQMEIDAHIPATGLYDFNHDGEMEKWFVAQDEPGGCYEFWIAAIQDQAIASEQAGWYCTDLLETVEIEPIASDEPVYSYTVTIGPGEDAARTISYGADADAGYRASAACINEIRQIQNGLLLGTLSPQQAVQNLLHSRETYHDVWYPEESSFTHAPQAIYLLGLAQEWAGQADDAVETYLTLWRSYPHSPFALMAQAKLEPVP